MSVERVSIQPERLRWVIRRAGLSEENAIKHFPQLRSWLSLEKIPTLNQLKDFASKFYVPFGYLFLHDVPDERIPFPMFRGEAGKQDHFNLNVYDTVMTIQFRQEWLDEYIEENDIDSCKIVGKVKMGEPVNVAVERLRSILDLDSRWAFSLTSSEAAISVLSQKLQEIGVFIVFNGIVGNNTHRPLLVSDCRGFALVDKIAPFIFVNSSDSKSAQLFTIIHELTHILVGISAGHAGSEVPSRIANENFCDKVAAEFLVPASVLREIWNGDLKYLSHRFKASELVVARRAHDLNLMSDEDYRKFWLIYTSRPKPGKKVSKGGSFYRTSVKRIGRNFAVHVRNAVNNNQLSYTDAYRLTGLYGKTFETFMTKSL